MDRKRVLIFSGTTEGRKLAEILAGSCVPAVVCVATEYGKQVMAPLAGIELHQGRMDRQQMQEFMKQEAFLAAVDATHPFAAEASENIRLCAQAQKIPYLRLQRNTKPDGAGTYNGLADEAYFGTNEECRTALQRTKGNILLTTGSKELAVYCEQEKLRKRLYVRVLPSVESIELCRKQGLSGKQIIAMQGPFSKEMNLALLGQYGIQILVTKESGRIGGFEEKAAAAWQMGISLYVIGNPEKSDGLSFDAVCAKLETMTGAVLRQEQPFSVSLIGMGMGGIGTLTIAAKEKIAEADYLFGAKRVTDCVRQWGIGKEGSVTYPFYRAEDIIPVLQGIRQEKQKEVAVLFSGDSGFYSGSGDLYQKLAVWRQGQPGGVSLGIYPGISSVSYFAAACGLSWQDAKIMSVHGRGEPKEWEAEVLMAVRYHKKVFLLVSGVEDVRAAGAMLRENGPADCRVLLGYQLSSPEEMIRECTPEQCEQMTQEGLYILAVLHHVSEKRCLLPQKKDAEFIRGKVPMTKEEVREAAVCKLKLTENAVVYDIGSGTGSVAVEIAEQSESIRVFAVEQKDEAVCLIKQNREKFKLPNIEVIRGKAPECLTGLPVPTHAFIGGSGGCLKEILDALYRKNPAMRVVITSVSLETAGELTAVIKGMPTAEGEVIQMQVSRAKKAGGYHLMQAENPVYIWSFYFGGKGQ